MSKDLHKRKDELQQELEAINRTLAGQEEIDEAKSRETRELQKKEALVTIEKKVKQARDLITECEKIADLTGVGFRWDLEYGMGGWYNPRIDEAGNHVESGAGWQASSSSC